MEKVLNKKEAISIAFKPFYDGILLYVYEKYNDNVFNEPELRLEINELYKSVNRDFKPKRDIINELRERVKGNNKRNKEEWYEEVEIEGKKKKNCLKLTEEGKQRAQQLQEKILKVIKQPEFIGLDPEEISSGNSLLIKDIIKKIKSGADLKIPTFQREYVWKTEKIAPLLFSLLRNYPIGAMLFWDDAENGFVLLDGLQRTFSLSRINDHPYAYINYEIYNWFVDKYFNDNLNKLSENEFNKMNTKWLSYENTITKKDFCKENMLLSFEYRMEIMHLINFIEMKWEVLYNNMGIPVIEMGSNFVRDDSSNVFNLINSQGVVLNNYEKNSAIWSKTPITLDSELSEKHFITKWKTDKEIEYRDKIGVKKINIMEERAANVIEPSDFIYSVIQNAFKNKQIISAAFFKEDKITENALEPVITLFMNILGLSYPKDMPLLGECLSETIKNAKDINAILLRLKKAAQKVEQSLSLIKNISSNKKDSTSIKMAASLVSLLINIAVSDKEVDKKISNSQLLYIFIDQYFNGKYSSGSTANAWKVFNNKDVYKGINKENAENSIKKYINDKYNSQKVDRDFEDKMVLIASLFRSRFALGESINTYDLDHIVPKSLFNFTDTKKSVAINRNYVNSIYNLQLIDGLVNKSKNSKIDSSKKEYYLINKMESCFKNHSEIIKEFNKNLEKVRKDLCRQPKNATGKDFVCRKQQIDNLQKYKSFERFISFQKKYIDKLIDLNGLLSEEEIKKY